MHPWAAYEAQADKGGADAMSLDNAMATDWLRCPLPVAARLMLTIGLIGHAQTGSCRRLQPSLPSRPWSRRRFPWTRHASRLSPTRRPKVTFSSPRVLYPMMDMPDSDRMRVPVLLIHGREDSVVPLAQSRTMADALEAPGNGRRDS